MYATRSRAPADTASRATSRKRTHLLSHMHYFGGSEAVEPGGRSVAVSADLLGVDQIVDLQVRQLLGLNDRIHAVAGLSEYGAHLAIAAFDRFDAVLAVVEDDAGEGMVDAVVDVVAGLAV